MEEINTINIYLDLVFKEVGDDLRGDEVLLRLLKPEHIPRLLEGQKELIRAYLSSWTQSKEEFSKKFQELYKSLNVPYSVISWSLGKILQVLINRLVKEGYSYEFVEKIREYLGALIDEIAKYYLKEESKKFLKEDDSLFKDKPLYKVHRNWIKTFAKAIIEEKPEDIPILSADKCEFTRVLNYPESLFVCMDLNLCTYIHDLHNLIHTTASTVYNFLVKGKYSQAYMAFKDLSEVLLKLQRSVSELYLNAYAYPEEKFFSFLSSYIQTDGRKYVSLIDVKELFKINELFGEKVGDEILKRLHEKLKEFMERDINRTLVIRGTTANFYMLNVKYSNEDILKLIDNLRKELQITFKNGSGECKPEVRIITVELEPFADLSVEDLREILIFLKKKAKESNEDVSLLHGEEERKKIIVSLTEKYRNIKFIREKLANKEIELVFHPIIECNGEKPFGVETLVRLKDGKKLIPAYAFIDTIINLNMIEELDNAVLEKLSQYLPKLKSLTRSVFVNLTPRSIMSKEIRQKLGQLAENCKKNGVQLFVELTEYEIIENKELVKEVSKEIGVKIAVDDFGSGYSSFRTVGELVEKECIEILKIDGSITKNILDSSAMEKVMKAIASFSRKLGLKSVAEFVENEEILKRIKDMGVDLCQGYYFSKPLDLAELTAWIVEQREESFKV